MEIAGSEFANLKIKGSTFTTSVDLKIYNNTILYKEFVELVIIDMAINGEKIESQIDLLSL